VWAVGSLRTAIHNESAAIRENAMLGEQVSEEKGKVLVRRVLPSDTTPKIEVSFQTTGKMLGIETRSMGTYTAIIRADNSLYGEGQGILTGKNGESATWRGAGAGRFLGGGAVSYRGAVYYDSQSDKWKRLNTMAIVFEYEVDADGNTSLKGWEWA
jgi:hypothetical protein